MSYTVKEVLNDGKSTSTYEWNGDTYWTFKVSIEDGTLCEVSRKSDTPPDVGQEYEVFEHKNTDYPPKLKKPISNFKGGGKTGGKSFDADPRKLRAENMRSSIHAAIAFSTSGPPETHSDDIDWILSLAGKLYDAIEAKAQVGLSNGSRSMGGTGTEDRVAHSQSPEEAVGSHSAPVSSGAVTKVDVLQAKNEHSVSPEDFGMMLAEAGLTSDFLDATDAQLVGLMNRIERHGATA